ncbi:MAG: hypothetical protein H5T99_01445 [Moorella sp. (in: Bacteria)]|nr:hypothetical protein [Moorella sp. (in: firmicutes)]
MLSWRCGCGEEFPGTTAGFYGGLLTHRREQKAQGQPCPPIAGLFDDAGQKVAGSINEARQLGLLLPGEAQPAARASGGAPGRNQARAQASSTTRIKMRFQDVELDPSLWILFDLARIKWPEDYDDTPESFAQWVAECCFMFYMEHAKELGFDILVARSLEKIVQKEAKARSGL